jgi:energy-coupling factor transporter ATP-binding protein EcfA2
VRLGCGLDHNANGDVALIATMIQLAGLRLPKGNSLDRIDVAEGEYLGIVGPVDSGKSAFLLAFIGQALAGISFDRKTDWEVVDIGYVPSNPSLLFSGMKSNLRGELQLSAQFVGRTPDDMDAIVHRFHIQDFLLRDPFTLSGGEMVRAGLAIVAAKKPKIWLLDQIYDWLHPDSIDEVRRLMQSELALGHAVVETHSSSPRWADQFDTMVFLDDGGETVVGHYSLIARRVHNRNLLSEISRLSLRLEEDLGVQIEHHHQIEAVIEAIRPLIGKNERSSPRVPVTAAPLIEMAGLSFRYPTGHFAMGPVDKTFGRGEIVAVAGPNGSGKSTFLQCVANLLAPITGVLQIEGDSPTKHQWEWARKAFYCFQNPDDQLYMPTTREEIDRTLEALGRSRPSDFTVRCESLGLTGYLEREPYQLARPIRRVVSLASGMMSGTPVILLDEPTASLDVKGRAAVRVEIERLAMMGATCLIVSHDFSFIAETATRIVRFIDGRTVDDTPSAPWPLDYLPPLVQITSKLGIEGVRYSDLIGKTRHSLE